MIPATSLQTGMVVKLEGEAYRVTEAEVHAGTAKLGGFVHARLMRLATGTHTDRRFRLDEKLEDLALVKRTLEYSYQAGDDFHFMDPESYELVPLPRHLVGEAHRFLREGMRVPVEFLDEQVVALLFPPTVDLKVISTTPPMHASGTSTLKSAGLESGMEVLVPLFIGEGETVRVDVRTGKYVERVREPKK